MLVTKQIFSLYFFTYFWHSIIIIIIIITTTTTTTIIIIILFITFKQGIYNYIPEINHVIRVYSFAAILYLQIVLHVMLFFLWNICCTFTLALSTVCVQCQIWLFCCCYYYYYYCYYLYYYYNYCLLLKIIGLQTFHEHHVLLSCFKLYSILCCHSWIQNVSLIHVCANKQNKEEYWEALTVAGTFFLSYVSWISQEETAAELIVHAKYGLR